MNITTSDRSCGECNICCTVFSVPEVEQRQGHLCSRWSRGVGCTIYRNRPVACRSFNCSWLMYKSIPNELRPDKCGVVIREFGAEGVPVIEFRESKVNTLSSQLFTHLVNKHKSLGSFVVTSTISENGGYYAYISCSPHHYNKEDFDKYSKIIISLINTA